MLNPAGKDGPPTSTVPLIDVEHFDGVVESEHIGIIVNWCESVILQRNTQSSRQVAIQQFARIQLSIGCKKSMAFCHDDLFLACS